MPALKSHPPDGPLAKIESLGPIQCGQQAAKHFAFDPGYVNLNHGSYGTTPTEVMDVHRHYRLQAEARPDAFVRYEYRTHLLDEARHRVARYLEVPLETCVLVQNASIAFDTVIRNLKFKEGDVIICFATVYDSFYYTMQYLSETTPVKVRKIEYTLPVSDEHICTAFKNTIEELRATGQNPRICVFDTVNSLPGVRMPFEDLTRICRENSILSCIDGAHGIGQFPLYLSTLDPDFFMSNCHKWLHVPRPCGFLYVPERNQHLLRTTLPTGFNFVPQPGEPRFVANFASMSTLDDTPYLCIEAAIKWRERVTWDKESGEVAIQQYTAWLAREGGMAVAGILGTEVLDNREGTMTRDCTMVNVRLPVDVDRIAAVGREINEVAANIMKNMIVEHQTAVNVFVYNGSIWVRLSAQVYLTVNDFERAGKFLKHECDRFQVSG